MMSRKTIDLVLLNKTVAVATRFLDDLIDVAEYPLPYIAEATRATRKIGLGFTGLADALIMAGFPYDSENGRQFAGMITKNIRDASHAASYQLAKEKGCFPLWRESIFYPGSPRRNASCVTIAPTGSVTTMAGCEGYGVEPIFAVAYSKHTEAAGDIETFSPLFLEACKGLPKDVLSEVARKGSCQGVDGIPDVITQLFKGAQDISPKDHLLMQAAVQQYVDNAVSKTVNLPKSATVEDISNCYKMAYKLGLKGITVFRDGCKTGTITVGEKAANQSKEPKRGEITPRPVDPPGTTRRIDTGCGIMYATVNHDPISGDILEAFLSPGPDGGCIVFTEATGIMISAALRGGIPVDELIRKMKRTHSCPSWQYARGKGKKLSVGKSCVSAVAYKLEEIKKELDAKYGRTPNEEDIPDACPSCGNKLIRAEGCLVCTCGYSRC
jgi:ribonucleoside-diphosphate reductase alpha chain